MTKPILKIGDNVTVNTSYPKDLDHDKKTHIGMTGVVQAGPFDSSFHVQFASGGWGNGRIGSDHLWSIDSKYLTKVAAAKPAKVAAPKKPTQEYRGNGKHAWETVVEGADFATSPKVTRLRVPGGWLYKPRGSAGSFVPMPEVVKHKV